MMRKIEDHIVSGDQAAQLTITVTDEPGQGGACHKYRIGWLVDFDIPQSCHIHFQEGPIRECGVNGITQEALLAIVIDRLRWFQMGPFPCRENEIALTHIEEALMWLQRRTVARIKRGVEGTTQA